MLRAVIIHNCTFRQQALVALLFILYRYLRQQNSSIRWRRQDPVRRLAGSVESTNYDLFALNVQMRVWSSKMRVFAFDRYIFRIKLSTGFTHRNLHGFARLPCDSTARVDWQKTPMCGKNNDTTAVINVHIVYFSSMCIAFYHFQLGYTYNYSHYYFSITLIVNFVIKLLYVLLHGTLQCWRQEMTCWHARDENLGLNEYTALAIIYTRRLY